MKKLIALSLALSMSAAFAEDVVYGTFVLNSSEPELILGVPWVNPGNAGNINVTDLIQTSTLENGDQLFYYENGSYKAWKVVNGAWVGAQVVKGNGGIVIANEGGNETLTRGNAIILQRVAKKDRSNDIIINGQVGTTPTGGITMARAENAAYTLIAPATPDSDTSLDKGTWSGVQPNDFVLVNFVPYYYKNGKWGTRGNGLDYNTESKKFEYQWTETTPQPSIKAGQGVWFVAQGAHETTTTWDPNTTPVNN